jgi:membrane protein DedA with SNARE-associated domain
MISQITHWILETIRFYGGWSVFLGVLVEQIIIPIPSPLIIMGAGFLLVPAAAGWASALGLITLKIVIPGSAASLLGALLLYYVGLWGGKLFVDRFQGYLGFSWRDVEWMGQKITGRGAAATLFLMRALPIVPLSLVSLVGGVLKMPLKTFLVWTFLGSIPRCYLLAYLGWQLGAGALVWAQGVNRLETLMSVTFAAVLVGVVLYLRHRVRGQMAAAGRGKA